MVRYRAGKNKKRKRSGSIKPSGKKSTSRKRLAAPNFPEKSADYSGTDMDDNEEGPMFDFCASRLTLYYRNLLVDRTLST